MRKIIDPRQFGTDLQVLAIFMESTLISIEYLETVNGHDEELQRQRDVASAGIAYLNQFVEFNKTPYGISCTRVNKALKLV